MAIDRPSLIKFCISAMENVGESVTKEYYEDMTDLELQEEADWLEYLLDKRGD